MRALAAFAASPQGKTYGQVCRYWQVDPAAPLVGVDDVVAADFRAALAIVLEHEEPREPVIEGHSEGVAHLRSMADTHERSERLRKALGG